MGFSASKILDYSSAQIIPILQGKVAIYNDYIYLIHTTNISDFHVMLQQSIDFLPKFSDAPMYRDILKQQHEEISHILRTLQIPRRHVRSLDFLGSALKFIAGNPDHNDYELLLTKQNFLIENNNKQSKINSVLEQQINEITNQINIIKKSFSSNPLLKAEKTPVFNFLVNRNNLAINYLNNIILSIVLAKNNLINPLILDELDIDNLFENEDLPISISNLLLVTKIKVLQNENVIHYVLKIPKISNFCIFLNLYPVSHNNTVIKLPVTTAAKCDAISYPVSDCVKTTTENICKPIISSCISEVLNNNSASCETESAHHLPVIQEIDDGVIILNDVYSTTLDEQQQITVKGTILLMFSDFIKINNTIFKIKKNATRIEAHPPKTVSINFLEHENKLSLPYLHKLNIENTNLIRSMNEDIETTTTLWWSSIPVILAFCTLMTLFCFYKHVCCKKKNGSRPSEVISEEELRTMATNIIIASEDVAV